MTGKQKRRLRGLGQRLAPAVSVGKAGLTDALAHRLRQLLAQHELVKVRLDESCAGKRRSELAEALADAAGAECVGLVGRSALLYRQNPDLPPERRIELP